MPENSDRTTAPATGEPFDASKLPVSQTPYVTDEFAKPGALPAAKAEIVSVELNSGTESTQDRLFIADPQNQLAKNLADIDRISEQLAELHSIIEPAEAPFDFDAARRKPLRPLDDATSELPPLRHSAGEFFAADAMTAEQAAVHAEDAAPARKPRRKLLALAAAAVVIAIPTLSVATVGPWLMDDSSKNTDVVMGKSDAGTHNEQWSESQSESQPNTEPAAATPSDTESPSTDPTKPAKQKKPRPPSVTPYHPTTPKTGEVKPLEVTSASLRGAEPIVAGKAVFFDVVWSDGSGLFDGMKMTGPDGIAASVAGEPGTCTGEAPASEATTPLQYTFAKEGTYRLAFTVTTRGCDGKPQSITKELEVKVEAAPAPPAPAGPAPAQAPAA